VNVPDPMSSSPQRVCQELVALHENKMEMVAQAQASAKALAEAQERDYREKVSGDVRV